MTYQQQYRARKAEAYKSYQAAYRQACKADAVAKHKSDYFKVYYESNRVKLNKYQANYRKLKRNDQKGV